MPQDKFIEDLSNEERHLEDYKELLPGVIEETVTTVKATIDEAIEVLKKNNPHFRNIPFAELKNNKDFQDALKEYMQKNPPTPPTLEILKSIVPVNHIKPNNKLAKKMTKDIISEGEIGLIVSGKNAKKEVFTKVMLDYDDKYVQFSGREKYKPYDQEVYDGVVTLFAANVTCPQFVGQFTSFLK